MTFNLDNAVAEALKLGQEAGRAAASWVTDGNTPPEHYARLVRMMDAGDPELYDFLPARPDLSGEWADAPTPRSLFEDITGLDAHAESSWNYDGYQTVLEELCHAWESGVDLVFEAECERLVRAQLPDDSECGHCGRTWNSLLTPTPAARCPFEYEHEYADDAAAIAAYDADRALILLALRELPHALNDGDPRHPAIAALYARMNRD